MHHVNLVHRLFVRIHDAEGQALAEYGLILGLVFVAAVVSLSLMGGAVSTSFASFIDAAGFGGS